VGDEKQTAMSEAPYLRVVMPVGSDVVPHAPPTTRCDPFLENVFDHLGERALSSGNAGAMKLLEQLK
jgi:hypothetical protein